MSASLPLLIYRRWALRLIVCILLASSGVCAQDASQAKNEAGVVRVGKFGMEGFRYLLDQHGILPLNNEEEALADPKNTIIILVGPGSLKKLSRNMVAAVAAGASILIASDHPSDDNWEFGGELINSFGVEIVEGFVADDVPNDCFKDLRLFPYVRPLKGFFLTSKSSPRTIFADFEGAGDNAIATMSASVLRFTPPQSKFNLEKLASYPLTASLSDRRLNPNRDNRDLFAVGGKFGDGRLLILGDHSVFVNVMILRTDNANAKFTDNCIEWLQTGGKKRCLFVEDGFTKTDFHLPSAPRPDNWLDWILKGAMLVEKHGDQIVTELEERDFFNQALLMSFSRREIIRCVLIVITVLLLLVGLFWIIRARVRADPARTLVTPDLAALIPHGNVLRQRFESQLQVENVYEAARRLVRDFLAGLDAEPNSRGEPPSLQIEDGYEDEAGLRKRIMHLWQIAYGAAPVRIKPEDWRRLSDDLKEILEDADNGWWKFVSHPHDANSNHPSSPAMHSGNN